MSLLGIYHSLPAPAKAACAKAASTLFSKAAGAAWDKAAHKKDALAAIYKKWQASFQSAEAGEENLNEAFADFFSRSPVIDELAKVGRDQYAQVDFNVLEQNLSDVFEWAKCPLPEDPHAAIKSWVVDLKQMLEENQQYLKDHSVGLQRAVRDGRNAESPIENYSDARKQYLESVVRQHRSIHFSGMATFDNETQVDMARVFIMPRVLTQAAEIEQKRTNESKPIFTPKLFTGSKVPKRMVILGGPGSGKTTLLEALAVAFAKPEHFSWSKGFPSLLPIFYRIRELEKDLSEKQNTTIWDCIQFRCSRGKADTFPLGFFREQMKTGRLVFLFDGLDEASSPARRDELVDLLAEFAEGLSAESRILISSRPHDYRRRFDDSAYAHYDLCEFDNGEIQTFIKQWEAIHERDAERAKSKGEDLWNALDARNEILALARNALLLTMIVRVHFVSALPESRLGLYEKCAETLLVH